MCDENEDLEYPNGENYKGHPDVERLKRALFNLLNGYISAAPDAGVLRPEKEEIVVEARNALGDACIRRLQFERVKRDVERDLTQIARQHGVRISGYEIESEAPQLLPIDDLPL